MEINIHVANLDFVLKFQHSSERVECTRATIRGN
jgi:hypothetical protein